MSRITELFTRFRDDEEGAALVEYTILIGIIAVAVIVAIGGIATWMGARWDFLDGQLDAQELPEADG